MFLFRPDVRELEKDGNVKGLIKALSYRDSVVRARAASALGRIGDARAVEPLCKALSDPDEIVRKQTATALRKIGDPRGIEALNRLLGGSEDASETANKLKPATLLSTASKQTATSPPLIDMTPKCSQCQTALENTSAQRAGQVVGLVDTLYVGSVCFACRAIFCPKCLEEAGDIWGDICPKCRGEAEPAYRSALDKLAGMSGKPSLSVSDTSIQDRVEEREQIDVRLLPRLDPIHQRQDHVEEWVAIVASATEASWNSDVDMAILRERIKNTWNADCRILNLTEQQAERLALQVPIDTNFRDLEEEYSIKISSNSISIHAYESWIDLGYVMFFHRGNLYYVNVAPTVELRTSLFNRADTLSHMAKIMTVLNNYVLNKHIDWSRQRKTLLIHLVGDLGQKRDTADASKVPDSTRTNEVLSQKEQELDETLGQLAIRLKSQNNPSLPVVSLGIKKTKPFGLVIVWCYATDDGVVFAIAAAEDFLNQELKPHGVTVSNAGYMGSPRGGPVERNYLFEYKFS